MLIVCNYLSPQFYKNPSIANRQSHSFKFSVLASSHKDTRVSENILCLLCEGVYGKHYLIVYISVYFYMSIKSIIL